MRGVSVDYEEKFYGSYLGSSHIFHSLKRLSFIYCLEDLRLLNYGKALQGNDYYYYVAFFIV
jgi:hypothetical protein